MALIFIVEDNEFIREGIVEYLLLENHKVEEFSGVRGVLEKVRASNPDVIVLDIMLPDGNGFHLARDIKQVSDVPIVFLTAKEAEADRITGFELGADDYVVKPFSTKELVMRIQALMRRTQGTSRSKQNKGTWEKDGYVLTIDNEIHKASLNEQELILTASEWEILTYLAFREGQVLPRNRILSECLDYLHDGSTRTVDTHIANVRNKLGASNWIETVRGYGYRFQGRCQI